MMNFYLVRFLGALRILDQEITISGLKARDSVPLSIAAPDKERLIKNLQFVETVSNEMSLARAKDRLARIWFAFNVGTSYHALNNELVVLKQAVDDDIKFEYFYHYPKAHAEAKIFVDRDWLKTLTAFPSKEMRFEIESGVDCYALGHATASIFHFMRVVEYGLRAMAKNLKVTLPKNKKIEWSEWQFVLTAMEKKVEAAKQSSRGNKKAAELDFYSGALHHFAGFKDMYRDSVMHVRREYEDWEAEMAMRHVRDFMNKLATKMGKSATGRRLKKRA